jgi:hypothetical protein
VLVCEAARAAPTSPAAVTCDLGCKVQIRMYSHPVPCDLVLLIRPSLLLIRPSLHALRGRRHHSGARAAQHVCTHEWECTLYTKPGAGGGED